MATPWIDLHCHIDKLEETPDEVLARAAAEGVDRLITIGTEPKDHPVVLELAKKYFPKVACTLGVHPHDATELTDEALEFMRENLAHPYVVAVAEIGLDYYYNHSPRETQIAAFRKQMELAESADLPVQIHTRDAEEDTIEILREFKGRVRGVIHCFTGTQTLADAALDCGYNLSISGVVTFKAADELRKVVQGVPLDRIHVETDSPFLAPVPMRGKPNTPAHVVFTAQKVAELHGVDLEQVRQTTAQNAQKMFPKLRL